MENRKSTPIAIKIKTEVFQHDEFKEFLVEVEGQLVRIGEVLYLRYEEEMEGVEKKVPVTIKLLPTGDVTLIRAGEVRMKLHFAYQEQKDCQYNTPYGTMMISTFTNKMHVSLKDNPYSGDITCDYDLFAGNEKIGVYHLNIAFTA